MPALHSDKETTQGALRTVSTHTRTMTTTTMKPTTTRDRRASKPICSRCSRAIVLIASTCLLATVALYSQQAEAASANRINMHQVSRQTNQCKYS